MVHYTDLIGTATIKIKRSWECYNCGGTNNDKPIHRRGQNIECGHCGLMSRITRVLGGVSGES